MLTPDERLAVTAPFGQAWPGPLVSDDLVTGTDEMAAEYTEVFTDQHPQARLGLVAAACASWPSASPPSTSAPQHPRRTRRAPSGSLPNTSPSARTPPGRAPTPHTLAACAERLAGMNNWDFRWD